MNGIAKITNEKNQKFKVVQTDGTHKNIQYWDLSGLTLEPKAQIGGNMSVVIAKPQTPKAERKKTKK